MSRKRLIEQVLEEAGAMASHAFAAGQQVPAPVVTTLDRAGGVALDEINIEELVAAHEVLSELVAPALPQTLVYIEAQRARPRRPFGRIPLVRIMLVLALLNLAGCVVVSLSGYINSTEHINIFNSQGIPLLVNELFFICAAALGGSFAVLFEVSDKLDKGTYDPNYDSQFWIRFVLGLLSGYIMATMIHLSIDSADPDPTGERFSAAALALLGGFSANLVQRILRRMIVSVESIFYGPDGAEGGRPASGARRAGSTSSAQTLLQKAREQPALPEPASEPDEGSKAGETGDAGEDSDASEDSDAGKDSAAGEPDAASDAGETGEAAATSKG